MLFENGTFGFPHSTFGEYRIVVSTCSTAGYLVSLGIPKGYFSHIFVDEAGQATVAETLIPWQLADSKVILLVNFLA